MQRRLLMQGVAALGAGLVAPLGPADRSSAAAAALRRRVRPSDPAWPTQADWNRLRSAVGGNLIKVASPLAPENLEPGDTLTKTFGDLKNPYYIRESPALTQTLGWARAWTSSPSVYAVSAETTEHVVAAVDFARTHNLRLVVKGGGHSYQGTSNAPDSLLIWTRKMGEITVHPGFTPLGCEGRERPREAVSLGAGAIWKEAYNGVTTQEGRYVQGGGCMTVGVAGLIQSGGFGSFSKHYGLAAGGLLEAEIVTADGTAHVVNAWRKPDLFWALKGGGGGTFGVVTRMTLQTHGLPDYFGGVTADIRARSDAAFQRLIARVMAFYASDLFNSHWGEQIFFLPGNALRVRLTFQGLSEEQARQVFKPFFDWIASRPEDFTMPSPNVLAIPAAKFWDAETLRGLRGVVVGDDRPDAPRDNVIWSGDAEEVGHYLHGFQSAWLDQALLAPDQQPRLCEALFAATRSWWISLQVNKGLAGCPDAAIRSARNTAINPVALDAFALVISSASEPPAYPGAPGHEPDLAAAERHAAAIQTAMGNIRRLTTQPGSYLSESDYFDPDWRQAYWGESNYRKLSAVKALYDPDGLFIVHHGVGSEAWNDEGFIRVG